MKIRLLELFGGIGAFTKALQRIGFDVHVVDYVEIDKYAVASYNAIHDTNFEPQDIKKWDKNIEVDIITHGSPCQDFSLAGLQLGASRGGQTRSSLMYETVRIVKKLKPQYVIWENVPNVLSKKHIHNFQNYIQFLDNLGYKSAYEVLNAKDYGIPQNRERLFVVSVLNGRTRDLLGLELYFDFPQPIQLKLKLKDMLENDVDEKYYINNDRMNVLLKNLETSKLQKDSTNVNQIGNCVESKGSFKNPQRGRVYSENGCSPALNCVGGGGLEPKILQVGNVNPSGKGMNGNVFSEDGLAPTLTTNKGEGNKIAIKQATKKGYIECSVPGIADLSFPDSKTRRGRVQENGEVCPTLMAGQQDICYIDTPCIAASRGRNPENPSDRTAGSPTEQRLEVNQNGTSNTITTVQKDNYVLEPKNKVLTIGNYMPSNHDASRVVDSEGLAPTVKENHGTITAIVEPKSCLIQPKDRNYKAKNQPRETHIEMKNDGVSHALRTNGETLVAEPIVCEQRKDERLRFFKGGCVGTLRTIDACGDKRVIEPVINRIDVPQMVRVRKYEVNCTKLCEVLRTCKSSLGLKNQDIAERLKVPLTKVEHWFRQDKYFAIPDENIWFELKALLGIKTDEFDESIMIFEEKEGVFEKANRCYFPDGLAPTITSATADEKVIEPQIIREQPLEREGWHRNAKEVLSSEGLCRTLTAQSNNLATKIKEPCSLRIRKFTPKECWRLMGFDDEDFEKASKVNSNTQLYKQAGNSIVVNVLEAIFKELFKL